jgi:hypothetical protein
MTKFYDWMITRTIRCSGLHLHRPNTSTGSTPASAGTYSFKATPLDSQGPGGGPVYGYAQSRRRPGTNMVFVVPVAGSTSAANPMRDHPASVRQGTAVQNLLIMLCAATSACLAWLAYGDHEMGSQFGLHQLTILSVVARRTERCTLLEHHELWLGMHLSNAKGQEVSVDLEPA